MSSVTTTEVVGVTVAVLATWQLLRFVVSRNSLSHIPGPKPKSWWKGSCNGTNLWLNGLINCCFEGNFDAFMNPDGWAFHQDLYRNYGGVVRLDMFYGVRDFLPFSSK